MELTVTVAQEEVDLLVGECGVGVEVIMDLGTSTEILCHHQMLSDLCHLLACEEINPSRPGCEISTQMNP